jgi:hypothetical protein
MPLSDALRGMLSDPRQAPMLRERAERVLARPITLFTEGDIIAAWSPLITRDLARELLDALAFVERLDGEEFALVGELALIGEDCYRAWSAELDTDGAEWRQIQWSYTERRGHRSMLLHVGRWDGEVVQVRTSPEGLGRLIRRLCQAQEEFAEGGGAVDEGELRDARDLLERALEHAADEGD